MMYLNRPTKTLIAGTTLALLLAGPGFADSHSTTETMAEKPMAEDAGAPMMKDDSISGRVVATVGGTKITVGHVIAMFNAIPEDERAGPPEQIFPILVERLVQQEAVAQTVDELPRLTLFQMDNEDRSLIASLAVERVAADIKVSPEEIQAAYDRRFAEFTPATEYNASHILVETEEDAKALVTDLAAGAEFENLAREKSTGPTGPNGGQLGWFGPGRMVPEFEAAVKLLEVGQVSPPVKTQFGWHVIILNETRIPNVPTVEQMEDELTNEVWRETFGTRITTIVDGTDIERMDFDGIDPNVLYDLSAAEK